MSTLAVILEASALICVCGVCIMHLVSIRELRKTIARQSPEREIIRIPAMGERLVLKELPSPPVHLPRGDRPTW